MRFGFYIKMCIENALILRIIESFFYSFEGWKSVVYYELLSQSEIINFGKYCNQLDKLKYARKRNLAKPSWWDHDNAKPHVAMTVREKLLWIDWDILLHLLYFQILFWIVRLLLVPVIKKIFSMINGDFNF